jgi:uncharacterized small protein (DUF1192 family)
MLDNEDPVFKPIPQVSLETLSIGELTDLLSALETEMNRVRLMIRQKKVHGESAAAMFRKQFE